MEMVIFYLPLLGLLLNAESLPLHDIFLSSFCVHCLFLPLWQGHEVDTTLHMFADEDPKAQYLTWTQAVKLTLQTGLFPTSIKLLHASVFIKDRYAHHQAVFSLKSSPHTQQLWCRHLDVLCGHSLHPNWWYPPNARFRCVYKLRDRLNPPVSQWVEK